MHTDSVKEQDKHGRFYIVYASSPANQSTNQSIKSHGLAACTCTSLQCLFSSAQLLSSPFASLRNETERVRDGDEMVFALP